MPSRRILALSLAVALAFGGAGCGGDDDSAPDETGTTTTVDSPTRPSGSTNETEPTGPTEPTEPGESTDPPNTTGSEPIDTTPNDSPLNALLTEPTDVGEGFVPDPELGDGSFDTDLCEEVTLEATWEDEASQGLRNGTGEESTYYTESIFSFSGATVAEDFVTAVAEGMQACLPDDTTLRPRPDIADEAVVIDVEGPEGTMQTALVRTGARVALLGTAFDQGDSSVLTDALLEAIAVRLA
jgi:hypothetical protein